MVFAALLIAQIVIMPTAPRLSPGEAVRVLRASGSLADRTDAPAIPDAPRSVMVRWTPGDGPFGAFPRGWRLAPTNQSITFGLPWPSYGYWPFVPTVGPIYWHWQYNEFHQIDRLRHKAAFRHAASK